MNKKEISALINKLRDSLQQAFPEDNLTLAQQEIFNEIDEFIMNFEDEL